MFPQLSISGGRLSKPPHRWRALGYAIYHLAETLPRTSDQGYPTPYHCAGASRCRNSLRSFTNNGGTSSIDSPNRSS
jgi:hypothetical protein